MDSWGATVVGNIIIYHCLNLSKNNSTGKSKSKKNTKNLICCVHFWRVINYRFQTSLQILYQTEPENVSKRKGCVQFFLRGSFFHWGKQNTPLWSNWHALVQVSANLPSSVFLFFFTTSSSYHELSLTEVNFMQKKTNKLLSHINKRRSSGYFISECKQIYKTKKKD